jgi:phosphate transport system substrate-binding protein
LIELTWSQANPSLYRILVATIFLMILAPLAWLFWPDMLLRECTAYREQASKFASEVDHSLAQAKTPEWAPAEWVIRIDQVASLDVISGTNEKKVLKAMLEVLDATQSEIEARAKANHPKAPIDSVKGTELINSGNRLATKARERKHQEGIKKVSMGLEDVTKSLGRLKLNEHASEPEGLLELLRLVEERGAKIESRIREIEAKQRMTEERLLVIRNAPVVLRISSTLGIADSLMIPITKAFAASAYNKNVESLPDGDVRRLHWSDPSGVTQQIEIVQQVDAVGFASLGQNDPKKRSDIHVAFRGPNSTEVVTLAGVGDLLSSDCAQVIALDAVGVLVNAANPVTKLSENQLDDLVSGKIANWADMGGPNHPVSLVLPLPSGRESVVAASFKMRLLGGGSKEVERLVDDSMGQDAGSLGLAAYSTCKRSKILAIQAAERTRVLMPSPFTIATEDYKYTVRVIAHHAMKASTATTEFMRFVIGTDGQKAVGASGYVDLNITVNSDENDEVIASIAKKVSPKRLRDAERLSTNLRFETGKADLDIKAQADIRRVVQRLAEPDLRERRLAVLGFADARGGDVVNLPLSESRAAAVADIFTSLGVKPSAQMGFGARMPVDTNDTEEGMQRNRRVELWILRFEEGN